MSAGARCAPLQRGRNRNGEMRLQPTAASPYPVGARIARPFVPDVITTTLREGARRVIGATAKPLYPIDGKAAGIDRRIPPDLPPRGRGTARGGGRSSSPVGARIARPFVPDVITTTLRGDARRCLGATAKPLYPIDGKAEGLDRRNPLNPRQGLKQVHFIFLAWNDSFCAEPMI